MVDSLAARGRSHTHLRELLDARDPLLHGREREQLLDTADALLFGEPEADEKLTAAPPPPPRARCPPPPPPPPSATTPRPTSPSRAPATATSCWTRPPACFSSA